MPGRSTIPSWSVQPQQHQRGGGGTSLPSWSQNSGGSTVPSWAANAIAEAKGGGSPKKSGGGGLLGAVEGGAHWVAKKTELAAHDIKGIPGGLVAFSTPAAHDLKAAADYATGNSKGADRELRVGRAEGRAIGKGTIASTEQTAEHPLRDPFQTALNVAAVLSGGAGAAARLGEAADALRAGEGLAGAARAVASHPPVKPRLFTVGDNSETVSLHASANPLARGLQGLHDRLVQKAINENPDGRVASYGTKRLGGALDETARYQQRMRDVPAQQLEQAAHRLAPTKGRVPGTTAKRLQRVEQAALELTSTNTAPEKAAAYHLAQAEKGVNPALNRAVSRLYQTVHDRGLLTTNEHGDVVVNAAEHPRLAQADLALAKVQGRGDEILARYGVRDPEQLQAAINAPGRYRAGAAYESATPGKLGVPSQGLLKARSRVARLENLFERSQIKNDDVLPAHLGGRGASPVTERLGGALSVAKDELQRLEQQHIARQKPVGIIGGETARPGRGHVSYASLEKKTPKTPAATSPGPVVGEAKAPVGSHANQGVNISLGKVPNDITGQAARHYHQIVRFVNTSERRAQAIRAGNTARRTSRDVLVRIPGEDHAKIPAAVEEILGKAKVTHDDVAGIHAALEAYKQDLIPGLRDNFAKDKQTELGEKAPDGHVWVDRNLLGDLAKPAANPRGRIGRSLNNINSAVTAATVYFKIGHIPTRAVTNAVTNAIQGSLHPLELKQSVELWHQLSDEEKLKALAASGQHSYTAMPHEGTSRTSKFAAKGANFYARRFDSPFRFNSLAYEARKAGFDTPAKFRDMLDKLENPHDHNMNAAEAAKVDWVAKRANRAQIAYDRMSQAEKNSIGRLVWFYPWLKGATMFAGHTAVEHPFKAVALGNAGVQGRETQQKELGDVPSYEQGLFELHGGAKPLVADFSTFSPFATPADLLNAAARPGQLSGFLNPAYTAALNLGTGVNEFGQKSKSPIKDAAASLFSPTPEAQIIAAYLGQHQNQSKRMFHKTPLNMLGRAVGGPGLPRTVNPAALHSSAARERSGR